MRTKSSETGRSMVEMLGVIAIIGLITVGAVTSVGFVDNMYRVNAALIEADKLAQDIIDTYSWSRTYADVNVNFLCQEKILTCEGENNTTRHKWGGEIEVEPADLVDAGDNYSFTITYKNVPATACEMLINSGDNLSELTIISPESCGGNSSDVIFQLKDNDDE